MPYYERYIKSIAIEWIEKNGYPHEFQHAQAAFDGDADEAFSLSIALENNKRGVIAEAMWRAKIPKEAFRAYLSSVWGHDHAHVIAAASNRRNLAYMFKYADFPLPTELPAVVTVWRGTAGSTINQISRGYSWTTDRDTACWFAMRYAKSRGNPLVVVANVLIKDIALYTNERKESEAVLMRPPVSRIDGVANDWLDGYERCQSETSIYNASC